MINNQMGNLISDTCRVAKGVPRQASVLLIENDVMVQAAAELLLKLWGYSILACNSIKHAEQTLQSTGAHPDIILSDLHTEKDDGATALQLLPLFMQRNRLSIPVIIMSGDSKPSCLVETQSLGWTFLLKPFTIDKLREAILNPCYNATTDVAEYTSSTQ